MIDVDKNLKRIQEIIMILTDRTPQNSKEKFRHLKLLDEAEQLANISWNASGDPKIYRLAEVLNTLQKQIVNTMSDNDVLKYYMTNWWEDVEV